ncbi:MAG TPA: hypothetical protein VGG72_06425 [Bryobacteraceae bacterium]|jgi:hypothetical protein
MKIRYAKIPCLLFGLVFLATAQDSLNNDAVVKMVKAGLGESLVVSMIQNQPGKYSMTADDMVKLKQQGVTDNELGAMMNKGAGGAPAAAAVAPAPAPAPAAPAADTDLPKDGDIGVYYKKAGQWEEMLPEVVNWKTGGVIKSLASGGIVKGDINGHLPSAHSRNSVIAPIEVLIYTPEGTAITEYQMIQLHEQSDSREFRTVTGGVLHVSGGATKDVVPFEGKKVAKNIYRVILPNLGAGEYGFLPPGASGSASSASIGKMYTFRVVVE